MYTASSGHALPIGCGACGVNQYLLSTTGSRATMTRKRSQARSSTSAALYFAHS